MQTRCSSSEQMIRRDDRTIAAGGGSPVTTETRLRPQRGRSTRAATAAQRDSAAIAMHEQQSERSRRLTRNSVHLSADPHTLTMSRRLYAVGVLLRALLTLLPLSTLHPDEWLQSVEVMSPQLVPNLPHVRSWDWQFSCANATHPPHLKSAMRATFDEKAWTVAMQTTTNGVGGPFAEPTWMRCPSDMQLQQPIRNMLFPWLAAGLPYQLYRTVWQRLQDGGEVVPHAPFLLFILPRLSMLLASVLCDAMLFSAARSFFLGTFASASSFAWSALAAYSVTFPALVWMGRTFSNATETAALAIALWIASQAYSKTKALAQRGESVRQSITGLCLLFGVIVAAGAFVRLSFLFWAWPIGVSLIVVQSRMTKSSFFRAALQVSTVIAIPAAILAAILCTIDSLYFHTLWLCSGETASSCVSGIRGALGALSSALLQGRWLHFRGSFLLTPLTNYLYNSNPTNVAFHGLHPRYLHLIVNLIMMIGPVAYAVLAQKTWQVIRAAFSSSAVAAPAAPKELAGAAAPLSATSSSELRHRKPVSASNSAAFSAPVVAAASLSAASSLPSEIDVLLLCVLWSGVLFLSLIPHQEPRFLLPLIMPAALLLRSSDSPSVAPAQSSRWRSFARVVRCVHVVACVLLLGVLHQGEQLRWLLSHSHSSSTSSSRVIVSYKLYTTPTAFLHAARSPLAASLRVFDVSHEDELMAVLRSIRGVDSAFGLLLVCPGSVPLVASLVERALAPSSAPGVSLMSRPFGSLHLSLDDAPTIDYAAGLPLRWRDRLSLQIWERADGAVH